MLLNIAPIENMVKRDFIIKIKSYIKEMFFFCHYLLKVNFNLLNLEVVTARKRSLGQGNMNRWVPGPGGVPGLWGA